MAQTAIGPFRFPSKKAAEEEIKRILHGTPSRTALGGVEAELVTALVGLHPSAGEKIGVGIDHIEVRVIAFGKPGFWIIRTDGSADDFSYIKALSGKESTLRGQCLKAMRFAIQDQIDQFRRIEFSRQPVVTCPLTGEQLTATSSPSAHVDHIIDFVLIADEFVTTFTEGYDRIDISSSAIHPGPALTDPILSMWQHFHADRAQLRIVHPAANLARARAVRAG